jgi:methionyl aminopeptidase
MARAKDPWELALMRQSGKRLAEVSALVREAVKPGVTTRQLDEIAEREILRRGGRSNFKGYRAGGNVPFPAVICASPNEVVVHGIPDDRPLREGDILSVDLGLIYGGYHSDTAFTVGIGKIDDARQRLLDETERSLYVGIAMARAGQRTGDIGHAIQNHIEPLGYGIVEAFVGHGIGRQMHEHPPVPNVGRAGQGVVLGEGHCLAIEPMVTFGSGDTRVLDDEWTVVTADGSLAAHFEHTIAVTPRGPEILTVLDDRKVH